MFISGDSPHLTNLSSLFCKGWVGPTWILKLLYTISSRFNYVHWCYQLWFQFQLVNLSFFTKVKDTKSCFTISSRFNYTIIWFCQNLLRNLLFLNCDLVIVALKIMVFFFSFYKLSHSDSKIISFSSKYFVTLYLFSRWFVHHISTGDNSLFVRI